MNVQMIPDDDIYLIYLSANNSIVLYFSEKQTSQ